MSTMHTFRVVVDCWYWFKRQPTRRRERREFLVRATTADAATRKGTALAAHTAACSDRLVGVEWRETWPFTLPCELGNRIGYKPSAFRVLDRRKLSRNGKGGSQ